MSEKDQFVSQSPSQKDPYQAKPGEFPVKSVSPKHGQGGGRGTAEGGDKLAAQSVNQVGPRHAEDSGPGAKGSGSPSVWGKGGQGFPVSKNSGEGDAAPSAVSISESVDLATGKLVVKGFSPTRVGEVGQHNVKIPSRS